MESCTCAQSMSRVYRESPSERTGCRRGKGRRRPRPHRGRAPRRFPIRHRSIIESSDVSCALTHCLVHIIFASKKLGPARPSRLCGRGLFLASHSHVYGISAPPSLSGVSEGRVEEISSCETKCQMPWTAFWSRGQTTLHISKSLRPPSAQ